jgi:dihydroflavonol-4-reductase
MDGPMPRMTFLVTGGCGFIGSKIVHALCRSGHAVRAYYRPGDDSRLLKGLPVERIHGDVCDVESLTSAASGCAGVFHTVGNMSFSGKDRTLQRRINVGGVRSVVEACRRSGIRRLVHTSSVNACGIPHPPGTLGDEETPFNWEKHGFDYAMTKHEGEQIALAANRPELEVVVVNPGTVFGAGDIHFNAGGYIRAVRRMPVLFHPAGGANCVHVDAVAEGHIAAFFMGRPGQRYILGGENLSYREMFATIASVLRRPRLLIPVPYPAAVASAALIATAASITGFSFRLSPQSVRAGYLKLYYSSAKAADELGLRLLPFRKAVEDAAAWYARTGW